MDGGARASLRMIAGLVAVQSKRIRLLSALLSSSGCRDCRGKSVICIILEFLVIVTDAYSRVQDQQIYLNFFIKDSSTIIMSNDESQTPFEKS